MKNNKKKSKVLFIITAILMVITIISIILAVMQATDTSTNLDRLFEIKKNKSVAEVCKRNGNMYEYERLMEEVEEAEAELERERKVSSIISISPYITGGISTILLVVAIIVRKKERKNI